ncbi:MAG: hypothetical protein IBX55_23060 [Methyloprofundus sp.]|nr:hypothetical protein [Methyloprofundus sp.]
MTTVFISGSRHLSRLSQDVKARLENVINQHFAVVVGDANGVDKAVQAYLCEVGYEAVTVFCAGEKCRNNLGHWQVKRIEVEPSLKGRAFYTVKDKKMAEVADYGFVLWDGKSQGSYNNILELLGQGKKALVYFAPNKQFTTVKTAADLEALLKLCSPSFQAESNTKNTMRVNLHQQQALGF